MPRRVRVGARLCPLQERSHHTADDHALQPRLVEVSLGNPGRAIVGGNVMSEYRARPVDANGAHGSAVSRERSASRLVFSALMTLGAVPILRSLGRARVRDLVRDRAAHGGAAARHDA